MTEASLQRSEIEAALLRVSQLGLDIHTFEVRAYRTALAAMADAVVMAKEVLAQHRHDKDDISEWCRGSHRHPVYSYWLAFPPWPCPVQEAAEAIVARYGVAALTAPQVSEPSDG